MLTVVTVGLASLYWTVVFVTASVMVLHFNNAYFHTLHRVKLSVSKAK